MTGLTFFQNPDCEEWVGLVVVAVRLQEYMLDLRYHGLAGALKREMRPGKLDALMGEAVDIMNNLVQNGRKWTLDTRGPYRLACVPGNHKEEPDVGS